MTRLAQALRWWSRRPCECSEGCHLSGTVNIRHSSIPKRHYLVLLRAGRLKVSNFHPRMYCLKEPAV